MSENEEARRKVAIGYQIGFDLIKGKLEKISTSVKWTLMCGQFRKIIPDCCHLLVIQFMEELAIVLSGEIGQSFLRILLVRLVKKYLVRLWITKTTVYLTMTSYSHKFSNS